MFLVDAQGPCSCTRKAFADSRRGRIASGPDGSSAAGAPLPQDPHIFKQYVSPPPPPPPVPSLRSDAPPEWADGANSCHIQRHAEYDGQFVVRWGDGNLKARPRGCRAHSIHSS